MVAKNDITGDPITSKAATNAFRKGWDRIFNHKDGDDVLIEKDYDGCYLITAYGNRTMMRLTKEQYDSLVKTILTNLTAEQVAESMKEGE